MLKRILALLVSIVFVTSLAFTVIDERGSKLPRYAVLHRVFAWPEGVTVWFIAATLWFIAVQAEESAKASRAAKDSADSSRMQIEHAIVSERAWLVMRSATDNHEPTIDDRFEFWWGIENTGKTPARILETQCRYELVDNTVASSLPVKPEYPLPIIPQGLILAPGAKALYSTYLSNEANRPIMPGDLDETAIKTILMEFSQLRVYGYVKYLDIFDKERESRFIEYYVWPLQGRPIHAVGFRPLIGAPAEYTKCT